MGVCHGGLDSSDSRMDLQLGTMGVVAQAGSVAVCKGPPAGGLVVDLSGQEANDSAILGRIVGLGTVGSISGARELKLGQHTADMSGCMEDWCIVASMPAIWQGIGSGLPSVANTKTKIALSVLLCSHSSDFLCCFHLLFPCVEDIHSASRLAAFMTIDPLKIEALHSLCSSLTDHSLLHLTIRQLQSCLPSC